MKKATYSIAKRSGDFEEVNGYRVDVIYGDEHLDMGVRSIKTANNSIVWSLDHLDTGFLIRSGFRSRKEAIGYITYELAEQMVLALKDENYVKAVLRMKEHQKKLAEANLKS